MYQTASDFLRHYEWESATTRRVIAALSDEALSRSKGEGQFNLGQIAWHVATSPSYLAGGVGFELPQIGWDYPEELTVEMILAAYDDMNVKIKEQAPAKSADDLKATYTVFDMQWTTASMLGAMISHEIHHRGQMSVLMRQAGLSVPSIYGPNYEATQEMMAKMAGQQPS